MLGITGAFLLGFGLVFIWAQIFLTTAQRAERNLEVLGTADDRQFPDFRYGMQIDPSTDLQRGFRLLKEAGFTWAKVQVRWDGIEPAKDQLEWGVLDSIVGHAADQNVNLLFSVTATPDWARRVDAELAETGPPGNPADMATFVRLMAQRYAGRVQAYEIWNEQNLAREWGGVGSPDAREYVDLLKAVYSATKQGDPNALVVAGALTPAGDVDHGQGIVARDDRNFLREMYDAGMKGSYDILGVHPSGFNNPPTDDPATNSTNGIEFKGHWSFYFRNFENYRKIMEEFGDGEKKIWFTEFGWASSPNPAQEYAYAREVSQEQQATYLVEAIEMARTSGFVDGVFVWNLNFAPNAAPEDLQGKRAFSIVNPNWTPRPAFDALRTMIK